MNKDTAPFFLHKGECSLIGPLAGEVILSRELLMQNSYRDTYVRLTD